MYTRTHKKRYNPVGVNSVGIQPISSRRFFVAPNPNARDGEATSTLGRYVPAGFLLRPRTRSLLPASERLSVRFWRQCAHPIARSMKDSGGGFEQQDYLINWDKGPLGLVFRPDLGADMPPVVAQVLPQASVARLSGVRVGDLLLSVDGKKTSALGYEKVLRVLFKERLPLVLHFRMPFPSGGRKNDEINSVPSEYGGQAMSQQSQMPMPQYQQPLMPPQYTVQPQPPQNYVQPQLPPPNSGRNQQRQQQQRMRPPHQNGVVSLQAGGHGLMPSNSKGKRKQYSVVWEAGSLGISFRAYTSRVNVPVVDFIGVRGQGRNMELVCINDVLIAINGEKTKALGVQKVLRWLHVIEKPVVLRFHSSSNRIEAPVQFQTPVDNQQSAHLTHYSNFVQQQQKQQNHPPVEFQRHYSASSNNRDRRADSADLPPRKFSVNTMPVPAEPQDQPPRKYSMNRMGPPADGQDQPLRKYSINRMGPPVYTQQPELKRHSSKNRLPPQHEPQVEPEPRQRRLSSSAIQARPDHIERDNLARTNPRDDARNEPSLFRAASTGRMIRSQSVDIEELSFQEAVAIVGRSSGKPIDQCEFGGVPLLQIREGTMQAKLMFIFAKACIAKEGRLEPSQSNGTEPQIPSKSSTTAPQLNATPGNPLGRNRHQFLTYSFTQDHDKRTRSTSTDSTRRTMNDDELLAPPQNGKGIARITSDVSKLSVDSHPEHPSIPEESRASSKSSNDGDMISLKDFMVQGSRLTERLPSSNVQEGSAHDDILDQHSQQQQMTAALLAHDISTKVQASSPASSSGMISLADMARVDEQKVTPTPQEVKQPSSFDHPLISELYGAYPDMYDLIKDKTPEILMVKKDMIDEIQDILKSLQMEAQFERHSYFGTGSMINPSSPLSPMSTIHDRCCFQCGKIGQLADLAVDGGRRELYCQDCWEIFFFSEGRLSPSSSGSHDRFRSDDNITTGDASNDCDDIRPSSNLAEDPDDDEVAKYSFHDSASSMSDMIRNPWRNLNSMSSMRDSSMTTGSSITADEVWL